MKAHLIRVAAVVAFYVSLVPLSQGVLAQAEREDCYQVDLANLKLIEFSGGWTVRDVTFRWDRNFIAKPDAERFLAVLKAYKIGTCCKRLFGSNLTLMSYMLTDGNQAPSGNLLAGESCVAFDTASLKVVWSDEKKGFVLTDGSTVVESESYFGKGGFEDILNVIKKYNFGIKCRLREWKFDHIDYWKRSLGGIDITRAPAISSEAALTPLPTGYPIVCRGAKDALIGVKPERTLALRFRKSTYPAGVGLSPGECSWLDRGLKKDEPDVLTQQVVEGRDSDPQYQWMGELRDPAAYWTFKAYNDGRGQLVITSAKRGGAPKPLPAGMEDWNSLGGNLGSGPAAAVQSLTRTESATHLFAKGVDGALWTRAQVGGKWTEWSSLGGAITSSPSAAGAFDSQALVVVARGADSAVWFRRLYGGAWEPWKSLGGSIKGAPAVVTRKGDQFAVFGVGMDGAVWQHNFDGVRAGLWSSLDKTLEGVGFLYGPAAVAPSVNGIELFAVGADSQVYMKTWMRSCDCWSLNWELLGGEATAAPAAVYMGGGVTVVLARGPDLDLRRTRVTSSSMRVGQTWESLGGKLFANPAALLSGAREFEVFAVAADNALWWRTFRDD